MDEQHLCQMTVHRPGAFRSSACGKPAKHEHNGVWFCGTHRPKAAIEADTVLHIVKDNYDKNNPLILVRCECRRTAKQVKILKSEPKSVYRDVVAVSDLERDGFADSPEGAVALYVAAQIKKATRLQDQAAKEEALARAAARLVPAAVACEPEIASGKDSCNDGVDLSPTADMPECVDAPGKGVRCSKFVPAEHPNEYYCRYFAPWYLEGSMPSSKCTCPGGAGNPIPSGEVPAS